MEIILNDEWTENRWECDPEVLSVNKLHHLVVTVDGGPKIISFVVDGILCDGDKFRQFGWGRYSRNMRDINGSEILSIGKNFKGKIEQVRIYNRSLLTSEAIGNYKAGL